MVTQRHEEICGQAGDVLENDYQGRKSLMPPTDPALEMQKCAELPMIGKATQQLL